MSIFFGPKVPSFDQTIEKTAAFLQNILYLFFSKTEYGVYFTSKRLGTSPYPKRTMKCNVCKSFSCSYHSDNQRRKRTVMIKPFALNIYIQ